MCEYALRTDGLCNTITTVQKDNYIFVGVAMCGGIAEEFYHGTGFDDEYLLKKYLDNNLYKIVKCNF